MVEIASLFSGPPAGPSQDVRYRQGTVVSFNPFTLENVVDVGGVELVNLPILGVGEATLLSAGSAVGIIVIGDEGHGKTFAILGRLVVPNTPGAVEAITLFNSQVFAATIDPVFTVDSIQATGGFGAVVGGGTVFWYGDNGTGRGTPEVTVPVGPSGRVLVFLSCQMGVASTPVGTNPTINHYVDVMLRGANVVDPSTASNTLARIRSSLSFAIFGGNTIQYNRRDTETASFVLSGLNEGDTLFSMVYAKHPIDTPLSIAEFYKRTITVIKL